MNILHVISGDLLTGSETFAVTIAERQLAQGDHVFIMGSNLFTATRVPFVRQEIHKRTLLQRLKNIWAVRRFICRNAIDIVHAHSRAASWVAHYATRLTGTAYVSSLHGRMHVHRSSRKARIYGQYALPVCENIAEQMLKETRAFRAERVIILRNGIP